jgi:MarR family transcriptional regulator, 2-MHQ and catechol-resistance regulon repressor
VPSAIDDPLISTFGRLVEASSQLERRLGRALEAQCGLPHVWFEVLIRLARSTGGRLTMGALAEQVALTTGGITRLIDRMQAAGYVQRQPGHADRRVSYTAITDSGRAKLDEAATFHAANLRTAFAAISDRDRDRLDALLGRLRIPQPRPR